MRRLKKIHGRDYRDPIYRLSSGFSFCGSASMPSHSPFRTTPAGGRSIIGDDRDPVRFCSSLQMEYLAIWDLPDCRCFLLGRPPQIIFRFVVDPEKLIFTTMQPKGRLTRHRWGTIGSGQSRRPNCKSTVATVTILPNIEPRIGFRQLSLRVGTAVGGSQCPLQPCSCWGYGPIRLA